PTTRGAHLSHRGLGGQQHAAHDRVRWSAKAAQVVAFAVDVAQPRALFEMRRNPCLAFPAARLAVRGVSAARRAGTSPAARAACCSLSRSLAMRSSAAGGGKT